MKHHNIAFILLCVSLLLVSFPLSSRERTQEELFEEAAKVLSDRPARARAKGHGYAPIDNDTLRVLIDRPHLAVVSSSTNGCALIAKDDSQPPVCGYTDAYVDERHLSPEFLWVINAIDGALSTSRSQPVQEANTTVEPLIKTQWNQGAPYNNLCPVYSCKEYTERCVTGCVATALAQVVNYYRQPAKGKGSLTYDYQDDGGATQTITLDYETMPLDFDSMLPDYQTQTYTAEEAEAVARLMYVCGVTCHMEYGAGTSWGGIWSEELREHMGYRIHDINVTQEDLTQAIAAGHPILYSSDKVGADGHMMILDGVDENGLIHINFGWGGWCDGYYAIGDFYGYNYGMTAMTISYLEEITVNGIRYSLNNMENTASIMGLLANPEGQSYVKDIVISSQITTDNGLRYTVSYDQVLQGCDVKSVTFTEGVTDIAGYAFSNCPSLTRVTLPSTLTSIGDAAFSSTPIREVYCHATKVPSLGQNVFGAKSVMAGITLYVPDESLSAYRAATSSGSSANWADFGRIKGFREHEKEPAAVDSCSIDGFSYLLNGDNRTARVVPNESIHRDTLTLPGQISYIDFDYSVDTISADAFRGALSLSRVTLPASIRHIDDNAFAELHHLAEFVSFASVPPTVGADVFDDSSIGEATLYVTNLMAYSQSSPWNMFGHIEQYVGVQPPIVIEHVYEPAPAFLKVVKYNGEIITHDVTDDLHLDFSKSSLVINTAYRGSRYLMSDVRRMIYTSDAEEYFTITFVVDGDTIKTDCLNGGAPISVPEEPVKEGYTFSGWNGLPETMPFHDVTVIGSFAVDSYTLTYIVDDETYKADSVEYGASISVPEEPVKEGYTFSGWEGLPETMPSHDVTVIGSFTVNSYTLTYMVDGAVYKTEIVEYGATIIPEEDPHIEGFAFSGWNGLPETMPAHDVTVTGSNSVNRFVLTYEVDGEAYMSITLDYGTAITPEEEPKKEGYTFSGWAGLPETMPSHDVTVTGTFIVNRYTLAYMVDDEIYKVETVEYGSPIIPEVEPQKDGYTFSGWTGLPEAMPSHDVTVTGIFTVNRYTLTYMVDDEIYKAETVEYGSPVIPEAEPQKEGYIFSGWNGLPETMPAHDVTVIGSFTADDIIQGQEPSQCLRYVDEGLLFIGSDVDLIVRILRSDGVICQQFVVPANAEYLLPWGIHPSGIYIVSINAQTYKVTMP